MKSATATLGTVTHGIALILLGMLAACGGGGDGWSASCTGTSSIMGVECTPTASTAPPPQSQPQPLPPPSTTRTANITQAQEFEPNNSLDNANPVYFGRAQADQSVGIEITGAVSHADDRADFFVFTPSRSGTYMVYLCADSCADFLPSSEVYLMAYDQSQNTIASTPPGPLREQIMVVELQAGLAYYVEINAYEPGGAPLDYRLVIID